MSEADDYFPDPVEIPIDGTLDLHAFHPREVKDVLWAYLEACQEKGILEVRVVHGKGMGTLRETVRAQLQKRPELVASFRSGDSTGGTWGATLVSLHRRRAL